MQLTPLPDDVVRRLVRSLQTGPVHERDVAWIVERAEGNAFFAEELVGAQPGSSRPRPGSPHGSALPGDLADLLLVRLDQLDDASRQVVRAASCAGRPGLRASAARRGRRPADRRARPRHPDRRGVPRAGHGRRRQLRLPDALLAEAVCTATSCPASGCGCT